MDQGVLVSGQIGGGADMVRKLGLSWPVKAAFWLRESDEDLGHLYIAIEGLDGLSKRPVYHDVVRIARETPYYDFDHSRVRVIGAGEPMARAAIDLNEQFPALMPYRVGAQMFGDVFAEDIYVYPMPLPAPVS
jgi:hypothetical protein